MRFKSTSRWPCVVGYIFLIAVDHVFIFNLMMSLSFLAKATTGKCNMNFITKFMHIVKDKKNRAKGF